MTAAERAVVEAMKDAKRESKAAMDRQLVPKGERTVWEEREVAQAFLRSLERQGYRVAERWEHER